MVKNGYFVDLKVTEKKREHYDKLDEMKKISPEAAVIVLTEKYCGRDVVIPKSIIDIIKIDWNRGADEIEKWLKIGKYKVDDKK